MKICLLSRNGNEVIVLGGGPPAPGRSGCAHAPARHLHAACCMRMPVRARVPHRVSSKTALKLVGQGRRRRSCPASMASPEHPGDVYPVRFPHLLPGALWIHYVDAWREFQGAIVTSSTSQQREMLLWYSGSSLAFRRSHDAPQARWHRTDNIYLNYLTLCIC